MTKVREHLENEHPHKEAGQRKLLIRQLSNAAPCGNVNCVLCGKELEVRFAFRCYYCGFFVCPACGPKHFGQTRDEYFGDEHSPSPPTFDS